MYGRRVGPRTLTFGVSGMLWRSALVMFDRETDTLWSHFTGEALRGPLAEETARLRNLAAVPKVRWDFWRRRYPTTRVLSVEGRTWRPDEVYATYHDSDRLGVRPVDFTDTRLPPKALVVGCNPRMGAAAAVPHAAFPQRGAWVGPAGDWIVYRDPEHHLTAAYAARSATGSIPFPPGWHPGEEGADAGGSVWRWADGTAVSGSRVGARLHPIPHLNVYWFAWADYHARTELVGSPGPSTP